MCVYMYIHAYVLETHTDAQEVCIIQMVEHFVDNFSIRIVKLVQSKR